jgi:hypothetical protein
VPYGKQHAREVGVSRTACGANALGWPYIWNLPFDMARGDVCEVCLDRVLGQRLDRPAGDGVVVVDAGEPDGP